MKNFKLTLLLLLIIFSSAQAKLLSQNTVEIYPPWREGVKLGNIDMPNFSQNRKAQKHFLTGMKSFFCHEVAEARYSFKKAQALDPKFTMAYIGEILNEYQLIEGRSQQEAAAATYQKMIHAISLSKLTRKERFYVDAAQALSDPKHQAHQENIRNFQTALRKAVAAFPDDENFNVLLGYSMLGLRKGYKDFDQNDEAGNIFQRVLEKNPHHPGALHFIVHAYENAIQFPSASIAAFKLALIAQDSLHAQQMLSLFFLVQGRWDKVIAIGKDTYEKSKERMKAGKRDERTLDYNSLRWSIYAQQQQGYFSKALNNIAQLAKIYNAHPNPAALDAYIRAKASFRTDAPMLYEIPLESLLKPTMDNSNLYAKACEAFSYAYSSFIKHNLKAFTYYYKNFEKLYGKSSVHTPENDKHSLRIMEQELIGIKALLENKSQQAVTFLRNAALLETTLPLKQGIPHLMKPADEILGDVLLLLRRPHEAIYQFKLCLISYPNRYHCKQGLLAQGNETDILSALFGSPETKHISLLMNQANNNMTNV